LAPLARSRGRARAEAGVRRLALAGACRVAPWRLGIGAGPRAMDAVVAEFRRFDCNGDGSITRNELSRVLKGLQPGLWTESKITQLMDAVDRNHDGLIQFEEFVSFCYGNQELARLVVENDVAIERAAQALMAKARSAHAAVKLGDWAPALRYVGEHPEVATFQVGSSGSTLLHEAALSGSWKVLSQLVSCKADVHALNKAGQSVVEVAPAHVHGELAEMLRRADAEAADPARGEPTSSEPVSEGQQSSSQPCPFSPSHHHMFGDCDSQPLLSKAMLSEASVRSN